ncbi:helix-turn-helix domain-containing protein [Azospirillum thermophilum]|uniref:Crp/Fnr family transcriptional regulator n=1 Tax=Azospirillum thermophilum TaxID=2202148 RepID=A0A2S2CVA7_9PROT|nr:helix-turn-helix domain-containing protein [Azospirillum thermophilum]AWK88217.1 hypothetical protein DEW08_19080 [Azospirillum thermophilum]
MDVTLVNALGACALLRSVPQADLDRLGGYARLAAFRPGDRLPGAQGRDRQFFILVHGHVELTTPASAERERMMAVLSAGDVVGLETVLDGAPHAAAARALDEVAAVAVLGEPFHRHVAESAAMAFAVLEGTSRLLRSLRLENAELRGTPPIDRLVAFLLSLAAQHEGPATIRLPYEKRTIAAVLGVNPESLSRMFARLRPLGVTTTRSDLVRIGDVATLAAACESRLLADRPPRPAATE